MLSHSIVSDSAIPWTIDHQPPLSGEFSRQEYTEELYKKDLHNPDNHDGVITDLEPDVLECEVKWALGSITTNKARRGDRIPAELFQILKDDAALNMSANLENSAVATGLEKALTMWGSHRHNPVVPEPIGVLFYLL